MRPNNIVTLLTDFGIDDPYVAMMKGVILSINPSAQLIDITHNVKPGSIMRAADIIFETFSFFPKGSIHIVVVDPGVGSVRRPLGLESKGHIFIGPDNGVLWQLIERDKSTKIVNLKNMDYFLSDASNTFHGRDIFAPVAAHISLGIDLESMGSPVNNPIELRLPSPFKKENALYGEILDIDNFGNLITNITQAELIQFLGPYKPIAQIGAVTIDNFCQFYADAEEGELILLINSYGRLEIAINLGRASDYVGIDNKEIVGSSIEIRKDQKI